MGRIWSNGSGIPINATNLNGIESDLTSAPKPWKASTGYTAGQAVLDPSGNLVTALATHTSGATFNPANWSTPYPGWAGNSLAPLRAVAMGDSTTAGFQYSPDGVNVIVANEGTWAPMTPEGQCMGPNSWFNHMCLLSNGQIINWYNAGIGSDTTTGMLNRFQSDVIDKGADIVFLGDAHNDFSTGSGITEATTRSNIQTMISKALNAGIQVILVTCYPDNAAPYPVPIRRHNRWLKRYAELNRLPVIDLYSAVVDPASSTGQYIAAYTTDGTHTSVQGAHVAGQYALNCLAGILRSKQFGSPWLPSDSVTEINLLANPLMLTDANGDLHADSWQILASGGTQRTLADVATTNGSAVITSASGAFTSDDLGRLVAGSGIPANAFIVSVQSATQVTLAKTATATATGVTATLSGVGVQLVTDTNVPGQLTRFKVDASTAELYQTVTVDGTKVRVGDRLKWAGVFKTNASAGNLAYQLALTFGGISNWAVKPVTTTTGLDWGLTYFECEATVPTGATSVKVDAYCASGTGTFTTGTWGLYNLTLLG